ncbi:hypothetical protein Pan44_26450 [Caulifigura coniformis]|uniref:Uncharacterized protein n=1 Tax=Caulifigura coniformis TaxID=2527983 RepID=A0A517SEQ7_9PLAN|nr:hypothetical protein [Caulifigura coniformis]QDT54611.1 hypothetical protein Pan44_26450 [Caulifigura coniformis]
MKQGLVTRERLEEFTRDHVTWVEKCVADGDHADWMPHLSVLCTNMKGEESVTMMALAIPFNTSKEKVDAMRWAGLQVFQDLKAPTMFVLSVGAWVAPEASCEPKDHPDRGECLIVCGMSIVNGEAAYAFHSATCHRSASNKLIAGPFHRIEGAALPLMRHVYSGWAAPAMASGQAVPPSGAPGLFTRPIGKAKEASV